MLVEENVNLFVCLKCMEGILVIENGRGDVLNLDYIDKFLTKHPETEVMTYSDFKVLSNEITNKQAISLHINYISWRVE